MLYFLRVQGAFAFCGCKGSANRMKFQIYLGISKVQPNFFLWESEKGSARRAKKQISASKSRENDNFSLLHEALFDFFRAAVYLQPMLELVQTSEKCKLFCFFSRFALIL